MVWYYAENGQQKGPVSEQEFNSLISSGIIRSESLVWRDGMDVWQQLESVRPGAAGSLADATVTASAPLTESQTTDTLPVNASATASDDSRSTVSVQPVSSAPQTSKTPTGGTASVPGGAFGPVYCNQCGRLANPGEYIRYGTTNVCVYCQPAYLQQQAMVGPYASGVAAYPSQVLYGGFWIRAVARCIDFILLMVLYAFLLPKSAHEYSEQFLKLFLAKDQQGAQEIAQKMLAVSVPILVSVFAIYHGLLTAVFSASIGKLCCGLRVVHANGGRVAVHQAIVRAILPELLFLLHLVIPILPSAILLGGYLMAGSDPEKRTLFDRICSTRVTQKP